MDLASLLAKVQGTMVSSLATPPVPAGSVALISNITNLYNTLLKAGLVSTMGTPTGAGETAKADAWVWLKLWHGSTASQY